MALLEDVGEESSNYFSMSPLEEAALPKGTQVASLIWKDEQTWTVLDAGGAMLQVCTCLCIDGYD